MNQGGSVKSLSIVIPAKNEAVSIGDIVKSAAAESPGAEIIVVDDGSTDGTAEIAEKAGATVIRYPESLGNGAAVKSGARAANGEVLAFMDGDGQHDPREFAHLLDRLQDGYTMVVGARESASHASVGSLVANGFYNELASLLTSRQISDLTSGFRVAGPD
jgi:glycosyltransferase involved in cell wall biosynthesis